MTKKTAAQLTEKQIVHRIRVKARAGRNRRQIAAELGITYDRVHRLGRLDSLVVLFELAELPLAGSTEVTEPLSDRMRLTVEAYRTQHP